MRKRLLLVELNELNFDLVSKYLELGYSLPNFSRVMELSGTVTCSEEDFENLEPWIQWPSVHTGKRFSEHGIFRLGDSVRSCPPQIFELLEARGFRVGAISPMNAVNRLQNPCYFIPDPWTDTPSDGSLFSRMLISALRQAVNDNSSERVTLKSKVYLAICFFFLVRLGGFFSLIIRAVKSRGRPWRKALFLDRFLHEVHLKLLIKCKPDFSAIFLNAGAHIQHHYLLNSRFKSALVAGNPHWYVPSDCDPVGEMLKEYDLILGSILLQKDFEVLIATGLTQQPVSKPVFYYRLVDHEKFLLRLGVRFTKVLPRMTRDFLVSFQSPDDAKHAELLLRGIVTRGGIQIFGDIDNRGAELFVTLTYEDEISVETEVLVGNVWVPIFDDVVFVAIKNGEHHGRGFAFFSEGIKRVPMEDAYVGEIFTSICEFFEVRESSLAH